MKFPKRVGERNLNNAPLVSETPFDLRFFAPEPSETSELAPVAVDPIQLLATADFSDADATNALWRTLVFAPNERLRVVAPLTCEEHADRCVSSDFELDAVALLGASGVRVYRPPTPEPEPVEEEKEAEPTPTKKPDDLISLRKTATKRTFARSLGGFVRIAEQKFSGILGFNAPKKQPIRDETRPPRNEKPAKEERGADEKRWKDDEKSRKIDAPPSRETNFYPDRFAPPPDAPKSNGGGMFD